MRSDLSKIISAVSALAVVTATLTTNIPTAHAEEVSPTGKGIVGGALLGGEIVMMPMAIFGVESGWAYVIGGGLGAAGGGVGGYFIESASFSSDGRVPVYMLAGGLALIIPTIVLTLNATRYHPAEGASEDKAPTNGPAADPGKAGGSVVVGAPPAGASPPPATPSPTPAPPPASGGAPSAPQSLIDVWAPQGAPSESKSVRIGIPVPDAHNVYSMAEQKKLGVPAQTELRMPLFKVTF
ncbi:MAG: hypothetical protein JWM74_1178 [Myxococcaceae bacterium]|jgi:hypothetical protein|nr:hypothetical protein [Myxococcaceae bacterium]